MRALNPRAFLNRFLRADSGAAAPLLGVLMLVLIGLMGIGVDSARAFLVRARLVSALDAAGLAVGARLTTTNFSADALKFVNANFKSNYAEATVTSVTATANADKSVISLSATATMPTTFMKMFGTPVVTVRATTEVVRQSVGLELVMVLDNTYSMEMSSSMPGLKTAANSLVNILFGSDTTAENLYIGLVPFSQAVNIGTDNSGWVVSSTLTDAVNTTYPGTWTGCVEARTSGTIEQTDDPPVASNANSMFKAYYSPSTGNNKWLYDLGFFKWTSIDYSSGSNPRGPGARCPQPATPMTNVKSKITAGINAMTASGSTMINLGAVWGWRMISPRWRGLWGGDMATNNLPLNYNTKNMQKAVLLMTDGENQFSDGNYTAYGELSEGRLGFKKSAEAQAELDRRLTTVCSNIKAAGITVYTVAFDNPDSATKTLLQNCATSTSYYFDAGNTTALNNAFTTIGASLSNLRVSK